MKNILLFAIIALNLSCSHKYDGVPHKYQALLNKAIMKAENNRQELEKAIKNSPQNQKEATAFLISYMPENDLKSLSADFIIKNVKLAYEAKNRFKWAKNIPDSIFMNEVLPYASLNEIRDNWRENFYKRFAPMVDTCSSIMSAAMTINKNIRSEVGVEYNTKRKKPDQNPSESIEIGMASCTGLSILLTDALRAVGIPSRIVGTPTWHDDRGNHNWCEVWINGKWYFTEYYFNAFDKAWFLADAGMANPNVEKYAIYASSFKPTGISFPLVWDTKIKYVHAENVSNNYIEAYKEESKELIADGNHTYLSIMMFKNNQCVQNSDSRVAANVDVFRGNDQMGGGRTAGANQDMNDTYKILLEKNHRYTLKYFNSQGLWTEVEVDLKDTPKTVRLYMEK